MSQLFVYEKRYKEALNALMLARSLKQRVWDGSQYELKQLAGVGMVTAKVQWTKCLPLNFTAARCRRRDLMIQNRIPINSINSDRLLGGK